MHSHKKLQEFNIVTNCPGKFVVDEIGIRSTHYFHHDVIHGELTDGGLIIDCKKFARYVNDSEVNHSEPGKFKKFNFNWKENGYNSPPEMGGVVSVKGAEFDIKLPRNDKNMSIDLIIKR